LPWLFSGLGRDAQRRPADQKSRHAGAPAASLPETDAQDAARVPTLCARASAERELARGAPLRRRQQQLEAGRARLGSAKGLCLPSSSTGV